MNTKTFSQKEWEKWPHELGPYWFIIQKSTRLGMSYYCSAENESITTTDPKKAFVFTDKIAVFRVLKGLVDPEFHIRLVVNQREAEVFVDANSGD